MKYLFVSLLLLSLPAQANDIYGKKQCLEIRNAIKVEFPDSRVPPKQLMAHYAQMCVASYNDTEQATSFNAAVFDELVAAINAKHAQHELLKL